MRVQTKLLVLLIPLFALAPVLVGVYAYLWQIDATAELAALRSQSRIARADVLFSERIRALQRDIQAAAEDPLTGRLMEARHAGADAGALDAIGHRMAASYLGSERVYADLTFALSDGAVQWTSAPTVPHVAGKASVQRTGWFNRFLADDSLAAAVVPRTTDRDGPALLDLAAKVPGVEGGFLVFGVDVGRLMLDVMQEFDGADSIMLLGPNRHVLATNDAQSVPWRISPKELRLMLEAGARRKFTEVSLLGSRYHAIGRPLDFGYSVIGMRSNQPLARQGRQIALVTAAITIAAMALAYLCVGVGLRHMLVLPLKRLERAAGAFGAGDLKTPLSMGERNDEIGVLASSLEQMRRNLNDSQLNAHRLINQDVLTGLPNRRSIIERLDAEIERCRRDSSRKFALMFIDLDNFKAINDSMGHNAGDRLVIKVAQRLVEGLRAYDSVGIQRRSGSTASDDDSNFVARLGGDEFLVIVNELSNESDLARVAERVYGLFVEPLYIDELQFKVSMSIGMAVYPSNGETADQLIKSADVAMYSAKTAGKNQYRYYDPSMDAAARESLELETELRKALSEDALELYFQPQIDLGSKEVNGCEVLLRWHHEERGWVSPADFVPVAEACGLIHELGNWLLHAAFRQISTWHRAGFSLPCVSINLSSYQVASDGLKERVEELIGRFGVDPSMIEFELTETAIFGNREVARRNLDGLRAIGARIALDDFGTGYSSLAWVKYCAVNSIKIDQSFVRGVLNNRTHRAIIASVVELSRQLDVVTVAEGVETEEEARRLMEMGCQSAQGYYFSRPLPNEQFVDFVERHSAANVLKRAVHA